jgi:type II secretion system protein H
MRINATTFGVRSVAAEVTRGTTRCCANPPPYVVGYQAAFTLIELILVMTLLAIVLAIASPSLSKFFKGRGLDNEARRFLALTRQAQSRAVSEGVPMVLWFNPEQRAYGLNADKTFIEEDAKAEQFSVESTVEIEVQQSGEAQMAATTSQFKNEKSETTGTYSLRFNPDGFAAVSSPEVVIFRQPDNGELRVAQTRNRLSYEIQPGKAIQQH